MIGDFPRSIDEIAGGVESVMLYLVRELSNSRELKIDVITLDRWNLGARVVDYDGFKVHYLAQSKLVGPARRLHNLRRLSRQLRAIAPDITHAHIAGIYSDAACLSGAPWVLTLHGIRFLESKLRRGLLDRTRQPVSCAAPIPAATPARYRRARSQIRRGSSAGAYPASAQ